ncbi:hypothetical protein BC936DRAFT_147053 [Jimgerdemannia flammicorona]|uniref:Uncharacterized protein n=1 Tax=Jimgerdemannia flammicorona TaxID=994334 RepID=A0A433D6B2_9FUNG|nr:hypothetical protein BC936DRAFT_147053 [Jimgerdemannia flammicorona]
MVQLRDAVNEPNLSLNKGAVFCPKKSLAFRLSFFKHRIYNARDQYPQQTPQPALCSPNKHKPTNKGGVKKGAKHIGERNIRQTVAACLCLNSIILPTSHH